jgi:hypothetical protein
MVIIVGGRAGEGKTTFCNYCIEALTLAGLSGGIVPFARGVKETAKFMGWNGEKDEKGRRLLQLVGFAGREYDINTWAQKAFDTINEEELETDFVFVDDWRFPNEKIFMSNKFDPILSVRIRRPKEYHALIDTPLYNDISETSLSEDNDYYDFVVENDTDLDYLKNIASKFVETLVRR